MSRPLRAKETNKLTPVKVHRQKRRWIFLCLTVLGIMLAEAPGFCFAQEPIILTASWYSFGSLKKERTYAYSHGKCADGSIFDENAFTCACRIYPLGTMLRVTNLANGRLVVVKVTDRIGKRFAKTRCDLSKRAFSQIADLRQGIIQVQIEVIK